jgi:hypothetical protein
MKRLLRLCSNRKSRRELLSTSEASWATTKSVGMCEFEEIFVGRLGVGRQEAAEVEMLERLDGRSGGPNTSEKLSTRPLGAHELPSSTALEAVHAGPDGYYVYDTSVGGANTERTGMATDWPAYGACCVFVAGVLHGFSFLFVSKGISTLIEGQQDG